MHYTSETFFRPDEVDRQPWSLAAATYNRCQLLLGRSETGCLFVPIRSMQYLGVVDREEIVFVDSQGYVVREGLGGRTILLAWRPAPPVERHSIVGPVPCGVIYYAQGLREVQRRLVGEFGRAVEELERKYRASSPPTKGAKVVPLRPRRSE